MAENCKVYNLESFTDEERERVEALINQIEEEKKNEKKWWIMPRYSVFSSEVQQFGQQYYVEPQGDTYSRSQPPLKCDFDSAEEAREWLVNYLAEEDLFLKAIDEINNLNCNLGHIVARLSRHEYVTKDDWLKCFESFDASLNHGTLKEVTKE